MHKFGVALVGAGGAGGALASALNDLDDAQLVAVAELKEEVGRGLTERFGATWYRQMEDVLLRPDVDVVIIATPSYLHASQAIEVAQAGKHVIVEKPLATTLADADRMIQACHAAGVTLAVISQHRFHRDALRLRRALEAGAFGRPLLANAFTARHRAPEHYDPERAGRGSWERDGGGAVMVHAIHMIDLLGWMLGPVESLSATVATLFHQIETEDTATVAVQFVNGALGTIQATTASARNLPTRVEIVGTAGSAALADGRARLWRPVSEPDPLTPLEVASTWEQSQEDPRGHRRAQLRAIFSALREGREPPVTGAEARQALEIVIAIYQSAATGKRVQLPFASLRATVEKTTTHSPSR